ncbi:aliphatic sulfonate ABC transporter substrate-binding protein [bacterium]|nr:aliphatic sulfonate ABC transporter substrate-binding protein [bacterium]
MIPRFCFSSRIVCQAVSLCIAALLLISGMACSNGQSSSKTLRVSLQPIPSYAPFWVARHKGWLDEALREHGIENVEWSVLRDGPLQNEAFAAGTIDVALTADTPAIIGRAAGLDIQVVGLAAICPESLAVLVPKDSDIQSAKDLTGKKIAATKGSFCHHLLALALQKAGMTLDDVSFINMAGPEINTSLQAGQIDAGVTWEPYISQALETGTIRMLFDGTGLKQGHEVIVARSGLIENSPEVIQALLDVYQKSAVWIAEHPGEAAELIADDVNLSPEQVQMNLGVIQFAPPLTQQDLDDFEDTQKFLFELDVNRREIDIEEFAATQFATPKPSEDQDEN